ncbi:serine/threonine-protein kinase, partial [uncultured Alcanivorax sp.]|uniref:serine/threonine-protein kinase n=1 Tax=uncultured Alcanivorax sp. TaxID=191215 RepID=UPI002624BBB9
MAVRRRSVVDTTQHLEITKVATEHGQQKQLNQYVLVKMLGEGAYGKVHLCVSRTDGKPYAIKIVQKSLLKSRRLVRPGQVDKDSNMAKMQREIAIMKKVYHPNVVNLQEVIDDATDNKMYLVIDYIQGGPVLDSKDLKAGRKLSTDDAWAYFRDVVNGLQYLHKNKIIHHDLKPENLLLSKEGVIKIADFGMSKITADDDDNQCVDDVAGTPAYVSPEALVNRSYRGPPADV